MFLGSARFSQGYRITYLFIIFFISQTEDLRLFGEFWRGCQRISWVVEELQRKNIYFWAMHTPLSKSFAILVKKHSFSGEVLQHCCRNRNLLLQKKSLDERFFFDKKLFLWRLSGFGEKFWETWRSFFFKLNKVAFYMSGE